MEWLAFLLYWLFRHSQRAIPEQNPEWTCVGFIYQWQTLIAGGLAVIAALGTIWMMHKQTSLQKMQFDSTQRKKTLAARAKLPDALSELGAYTDSVLEALTSGNYTKISPPHEAIRELKDSIEHIDEGAAARVYELVQLYQVQRVRIEDYSRTHAGSSFDIEGRQFVYDTAKLGALTDSLYNYARNREDQEHVAPLTGDQIRTALRGHSPLLVDFDDEDNREFVGVQRLIDRRHPRET